MDEPEIYGARTHARRTARALRRKLTTGATLGMLSVEGAAARKKQAVAKTWSAATIALYVVYAGVSVTLVTCWNCHEGFGRSIWLLLC